MADSLQSWEHIASDGSHTWSEPPNHDLHIFDTDSILHKAAYHGDIAQLALALVGIDDVDNRGSSNYCTPLHLAIRGNQADAVKVLLAAGADPSIEDDLDPCNMIHHVAIEAAALSGKTNALSALIGAGVEVPARALRVAASLNQVECMRTVLQEVRRGHIAVEVLLNEVREALVIAAACWHEKAVDFCLTQVPNFPDPKLENDKKALTNALLAFLDVDSPYCKNTCREHYANTGISPLPILKRLVSSGASISYGEYWTLYAFHGLGAMRSLKSFLSEHGLQIDDNYNTNPPFASTIVGNTDTAAFLEESLTAGASATERDINGNTPLHCAAKAAFVDILIKHGADIHATNAQGRTPLYTACCGNRPEVAQQLIAHGSDVSKIVQDKHWLHLTFSVADWRPNSHYGQPKNYDRLFELLLSHGANMEAATDDGVTALHFAVEHCALSLVRCLVEHDADPCAMTKAGQNALHILCFSDGTSWHWSRSGYNGLEVSQIAHSFIDKGVDPNARDNSGDTPLHGTMRDHSAVNWRPDLFNALLERGANLDALNYADETSASLLDHDRWRFNERGLLEARPPNPIAPVHIGCGGSGGRNWGRGSCRGRGRGRGTYQPSRESSRSTWT